ncbi:MAG: hypothetical protein ACOCQR_02305 [bacterium]
MKRMFLGFISMIALGFGFTLGISNFQFNLNVIAEIPQMQDVFIKAFDIVLK